MVNTRKYKEMALQGALKGPTCKKHCALLIHRGKVISIGINNYKRQTISSRVSQCVL